MRALVQRVSRASVTVAGETTGAIERGLLVFLGVAREDSDVEVDYLTRKIVGLRVFEDADGRMNRSVTDVGGSVLLVSQFTLYGDVRRGRRPGFDRAAQPEVAEQLYLAMRDALGRAVPVATGRFGAKMAVDLVNDGPATFWIDTADR
jgi:D-aminoacyl-tRNA deacylase